MHHTPKNYFSPWWKKALGTGAKCSVLVRYLHPAKTVKETLVNMRHNERLHDLVAIREETQIVKRKNQPWIIFHHEQFDGICGISIIFIHYLQRFHHLVIPSGWIVFCIVFHANFVLYFVSCFVSLFVSDFVSLFVSFFLYVTYVQKLSRTRNGFDPVSHSFISAI